MILTRKQEEGLKIAVARYNNHEAYTCIAGYAGTGKSTLVRFIIEALQLSPESVVYASYTGKAAEVLRKKGNDNAVTLHKLLYNFALMPDGSYVPRPRETLEGAIKLIVIDECSMVPQTMVDLIASHHIHTIYLGDPFQLKPIATDDESHLLDNPHIFLDEVMRQATESEIIQISMKIRNQEPLNLFDGKEVKVIKQSSVVTGMLSWADQILVAKNATRTAINTTVRDMLGFHGLPQDGDKVICKRNYWWMLDSNGNPLINGAIGYLQNPSFGSIYVPDYINENYSWRNRFKVITADVLMDSNDSRFHINIDQKQMIEGVKDLNPYQEAKLTSGKGKHKLNKLHLPLDFDYGYALTYWKSQGSEWDKVLVIEENFPFDKLEHQRALYTACTRASKQLVLALQ